jgi:two-component sensor histidine kinase
MFKLLLSVLLFFSSAGYTQSLTPEEAKALTNKLPYSKPDTGQINSLLKLAKYQVFKPGENKIDLDSAANYIKAAENINAAIKSKWAAGYILLIRSYLLKESGQREKAKESVKESVDILKNETDKNLLGEAYMELSGYYDYDDPNALIQRIGLVRLAVNYYDQAGDIQQKAASLQMLGDLYQIKGSNYIALQQLQASLDAYNSINYKQVQGIYCLMGTIYARLREFVKALDKELLALKTAEAVGDSSMQLCEIYNYLGEIYLGLAEKEKAISYYTNALEVAQKHNDVFTIYLANVKIANVWAALNQPYRALQLMKRLESTYEKPKDNDLDYNIARCYITSYCLLKQFEKARPYANKLIDMVNTQTLSDNAAISNYTVAIRFFTASGEVTEANKYLEKHNEIATRLNNFYYLAANQKLRFMLDTTLHDYKKATIHLLEFNRLNDSVSLQTKNRQISELQVQYETEQKEKDIQVKDQRIQLLKKEDELQKSKVQHENILRNISFAIAILLIVVMALLYSRYRLKQRTNKKLELQQSEIAKKNEFLQHLVNEKDWLVKEIHHRVKNNLQIVMSLLNSQSAYINNESALTAIHDSQHRVHAMSLIHQKLYNTDNLSSIDMSLYIRELVSYLAESFETGQRVRFEFHLAPIEMDVSEAVPLGLILNEAITNSIKYAFPESRDGVISISLSSIDSDHCSLIISDNGIGIPLHLNNKKPGSLGMSLMQGLTEDLEGDFSIDNKNGTTIKIEFVHDVSVKRPGVFSEALASNN